MPEEGVEPSRPFEHMILNHACLPIPAPGRVKTLREALDKKKILSAQLLFSVYVQRAW